MYYYFWHKQISFFHFLNSEKNHWIQIFRGLTKSMNTTIEKVRGFHVLFFGNENIIIWFLATIFSVGNHKNYKSITKRNKIKYSCNKQNEVRIYLFWKHREVINIFFVECTFIIIGLMLNYTSKISWLIFFGKQNSLSKKIKKPVRNSNGFLKLLNQCNYWPWFGFGLASSSDNGIA